MADELVRKIRTDKGDLPIDYNALANKPKYAVSSTEGGSATSAEKLNSNAGSATQPVYFANGVPVKTTYTLGKSVPSNAVFTDTTELTSMTGTLPIAKGGTGATTKNAAREALGAVSKDGDTMTGNLTINNNSNTTSALGLQAPNNAQGKQAYSRILKNADASTDYGLQLRDYAHGGNETNNSSTLVICSKSELLEDKLRLINEVNGDSVHYRLYGEHHKPTLSELGISSTTTEINKLSGLTASTAELNYVDGVTSNIQTQLDNKLSTSGGTLTGNLTVNSGGTSALGLQAPNDAQGKSAYSRIFKNASATVDYGLQLRDYAHGGSEIGNSSMIVLCDYNEALENKIKFVNEKGGVSTQYRLYGEHNKPTLSTLGVTATAAELNKLDGLTATAAELNYCDGVTSNIQTQLNGKANSSHGDHVTFSTTTPKAAGTAAVGTASTVSRSDHVHPVQTTVSGNAGTATTLKNARTFRTDLGSTSTASFDGSENVTPGVTGTLPIANGGTGATTVAGIRANLGNLGKVYRQNPVDLSVTNNTYVTLASLTLPAGNYIVTGNHVWGSYTAGSVYNDCIRVVDGKIFCFCRGLMDNGGGMASCAIVQLEEETTLSYQTYHSHTTASTAVDVHFYAIKIS